ncbi:MAG: hypothetical protein JJT78_01810 [Leptospira sp.]|nr:hypothetical protein [Leptospira sp.]
MNQKSIIYIGITTIALLLAYFMFSTSDNKKKEGRDAMSSNTYQSGQYKEGRDALASERNDKSIFDENNGFLDFSGVREEDDGNSKNKKHDVAGLSPEERAKRRELVIEKYSELAKQFPKNRYIPRKYTPEEEEAIKERDANMNYLQERLLSNDSLTPNEKAYFYANKQDESKEKLELMNYSIEKLTEANALPESSKKLVDERIASIQKRLEVYDKEYQQATEEGGSKENFQ